MTIKYLTLIGLAMLSSAMMTACSSAANGDAADSGDGIDNTRFIAGTSAIGAPGSYSNNCLGTACARANSDGNYLLVTEATQSSLVSSDLALSNGSPRRLYSRYRYDDGLTSALVNINPTTHALLDAWSVYSESTPDTMITIEDCAEDITCAGRLASSFTENVEETMLSRLEELLGEAYPAGRSPFDDIYFADQEDPLDVMHDYLTFVVTATDFEVRNNNGDILTSTSIASLIRDADLSSVAITDDEFSAAQLIDPTEIGTPTFDLEFSVRISPSATGTAPVDFLVTATEIWSENSPVTFTHDLTLASGTTLNFDGDIVETTVAEGGQHVWVVTATDSAGNVLTEGRELTVRGIDPLDPVFGGEGSCLTPEPLNANSQNTCQEAQNGSLSSCDIINSGSVALITSPAPCARETQNDGDLYGVCTLLDIELRVFTYENPRRPNNVETFLEAQTRVAQQCANILDGNWSTEP